MKEFFSKMVTLLKENKKYQIAVIVVVAILAAGSVWGYYLVTGGDFSISEINKPDKEVPVETVLARKLDGVIVNTEEETNPYPVAVMVENMSTVRPQSGISSASIVYEALAEGGITRFMLVFPGDKNVAKNIGPVRSARSYYIEWVSEYDALYAFSGAYPPVLAEVSGLDIKNINAMYEGSKYYWRDNSTEAPHNMFTSSEKLGYAVRDKGLEGTAKFRAWKFKDEAALEDRPTDVKTISIDFSGSAYSVEYKYNRESNTYLRFNAGAAHTDRNTGEQLAPKNVVVYKLPTRVIDDHGRLELDVIGEGEATMFSNGQATKGTWKKTSRTDRTLFYDENGKEYEFNRGQTWVDVIPEDKGYEYN